MLAIRMQRVGRKGHAQFRVIVQDSRFSPSGGKVVAYVGSYDPHTKAATLDSEKIGSYLDNGAQPSDRVVNLLKKEGVKLPKWATPAAPKKGAIRNPEKLKKNRPPEEKSQPKTAAEPEAEVPEETPTEEAPAAVQEATTEAASEDTPDAEPKEEAAEASAPEEPAETTEKSAPEVKTPPADKS